MFHLTVAILPVLLLGLGLAIAAMLLTGLGLLLAALAGGTSVVLLVREKKLRRCWLQQAYGTAGALPAKPEGSGQRCCLPLPPLRHCFSTPLLSPSA